MVMFFIVSLYMIFLFLTVLFPQIAGNKITSKGKRSFNMKCRNFGHGLNTISKYRRSSRLMIRFDS